MRQQLPQGEFLPRAGIQFLSQAWVALALTPLTPSSDYTLYMACLVCLDTDPWSRLHAAHWLSRFVWIIDPQSWSHSKHQSPTLADSTCTLHIGWLFAWILIPDPGCAMYTGFLWFLGTHP